MTDLYERYLVRNGAARKPDRSPVAKDRDRLIHSSALRRLQGKSQIVGVEVTDFFRTRLTHTLECAQIGRAIATNVASAGRAWEGCVEEAAHFPDLVEAACLAHDLGHPPFGHNGEVILCEKMKEYGGELFEGNAQSFRVVTFVEAKGYGLTKTGGDRDRWVGLDLTRTTLRALLKYPWPESHRRTRETGKFGVYDNAEDREYSDWVWDGDKPVRTLATRIMDVADDIAYAAHDFEDGVWAGMIPLSELLRDDPRQCGLLKAKVEDLDKKGLFVRDHFESTLRDLLHSKELDYLRLGPYDGTRYARSALKDYTATLIGVFIDALTESGEFNELSGDLARRLELLKAMAWQWMIGRTDIETHQYGQRRLVAEIFDGYWLRPEMLPRQDEWKLVPKDGVGWLRHRYPAKARFICDHIAGMTDGYARAVYTQMIAGTQARELRHAY